MNFTDLSAHYHQSSKCTQINSVLRSWVEAKAALVCTAEAVTVPHISEEVARINFEYTSFFTPTDSDEQIAANGIFVLRLDELNSLRTDLEKADFVHDQLNLIQIEAQESVFNAAFCNLEMTPMETELYNSWVSKDRSKRKPLSAPEANPEVKTIAHGAKVGKLLRSYLDEFFTAYAKK